MVVKKILLALWQVGLSVACCVLCARWLVAAGVFQAREWGTWIFIVGSVAAGFYKADASWFAAILILPLLTALDGMGVPVGPQPVTTLLSGLFIGSEFSRLYFSRTESGVPSKAVIAADIAASAVILALLVHSEAVWHSRSAISEAAFGFASPQFGLNAAHVLLLGLLLVRRLSLFDAEVWRVSRNVDIVFICHLVIVVSCVAFQLSTQVPAPYGTHLESAHRAWIPTLPAHDIHTLGAWSLAICAYSLARATAQHSSRWWIFCSGVAVALTVLSWSRAAWVGLALVIIVVTLKAGHRRWVHWGGAAVLLTIIILALVPSGWKQSKSPYLSRLVSTIDVGHWAASNQDRLDLYRRAVRMAVARPIFGGGPGSFFATSSQYSDERIVEQKFAHNALLQLTAECGLLAGIAYLAAIILPVSAPVWKKTWSSDPVFPIWLATIGFLITQQTANAINIFSDQHVLFSWLLAALVCSSSTNQCFSRESCSCN